ncbi:RNA polymerase II mediator complex subunit Sin4 [Xylariomycetidae sp. FL2044]|nr:RNA polymerase II mediator complex subunit Sin4 [Xylariomycetidae sp. FL2044]
MTNNSDNMPLILDNPMGGAAMQLDLDDDDLFGEGIPLTLSSGPPSHRLRQRVDELRGRGSCQGIAWSKSGTIAAIGNDGQTLQIMYLRADPKDARWNLSEPETVPLPDLVGGPIVHLSWAPVHSELAVIDAVGRVQLLNFHINLNQPTYPRRWDADPVDDLHSVVGTYWLHQTQSPPSGSAPGSRFTPIYGPAMKNGSTDYRFETSGYPNMGPSHPNPNKSALICITTNGLLKMFWSQNNNKQEETTLELESATSGDDLVTHAAVCADKSQSVFIALATTSKQLRVVQVAVSLRTPKPENPQNIPPGGHMISPSLAKRHIAATSWFQPASAESRIDASMTKISHIEMLPGIFSLTTKEWTPFVILIVRSYVPESEASYNQEVQSIIDRWELIPDQPQTVHSAFEQLGTRRNSVGSTPQQPLATLKKLESIVVNKVVMGVHVVSHGKVVCLTYNDGSIEYRNRSTMAELYQDVNLNRVSSMLDAGFTQTGRPLCLQMALSPSNLSVVQMYEHGPIKWHNLEYTLADPATMSDSQLAAVTAALTISTAQAAFFGSTIDDILAVARKFAHKDQFVVKWVTDLMRLMRIHVDYSEDAPHDHLIRNQMLQQCFSIMGHLGWNGEFQPSHIRSKVSMIAVSLRNMVILVTLANNAQRGNHQTALDEPEVVNILAGCVKWSSDLLGWICDSLFCLLDDTRFMGLLNQTNQSQLHYMTAYLHSKHDIALHMVLCSATRGLLSAVCRRINLVESFSTRAVNWYETRPEISDINNNNNPHASAQHRAHMALAGAYRKIKVYTSSALIKANEFEQLVSTLGADIRSAYSTAFAPLEQAAKARQSPSQNPNVPKPDPSQEARKHCEIQMLLLHPPPPSFLPVIQKFFRKDLTELRARTNIANLFFSDFSVLELDDEPRCLEKRRARGTRVDFFSRTLISRENGPGGSSSSSSAAAGARGRVGGVRWRVCIRCASIMENIPATPTKPGLTFLSIQQKLCCCGGRLALLP